MFYYNKRKLQIFFSITIYPQKEERNKYILTDGNTILYAYE